ncbi:MAG: radical SAM protein [Afipia sp.]|nr:radical SAM protein [Afipia sp.]
MMRSLYRLYHTIPTHRRVAFVARLNEMAENSRLISLFWRKTVLRYHYLHGHKQGLTIEITDKCNLKCTYCPKSLDIGVKGSHMDWATFERAFSGKLEEGSLDAVNLVGFGEPFLYPHLERAVRHIKAHDPKIQIRLTSNGILIGRRWGEILADAGLDQITISVNATSAAQYRRINAADEYDKVVRNTIEFLDAVNQSAKPMTVFIQVMSVLNDDEQVEQFRAFWKPHLGRVGTIQVQPFVNWAGQIDTGAILEGEERAREASRRAAVVADVLPATSSAKVANSTLMRELKSRKKEVDSPFHNDTRKIQQQPYPCYHLHKTRIVSREGNALACCMVYPEEQGDLQLGSLKDHSFVELYQHGKIEELRAMDLEGRLGEVKPCDTCDAWKTVPNIWWRNPLFGLIGPKWF